MFNGIEFQLYKIKRGIAIEGKNKHTHNKHTIHTHTQNLAKPTVKSVCCSTYREHGRIGKEKPQAAISGPGGVHEASPQGSDELGLSSYSLHNESVPSFQKVSTGRALRSHPSRPHVTNKSRS